MLFALLDYCKIYFTLRIKRRNARAKIKIVKHRFLLNFFCSHLLRPHSKSKDAPITGNNSAEIRVIINITEPANASIEPLKFSIIKKLP